MDERGSALGTRFGATYEMISPCSTHSARAVWLVAVSEAPLQCVLLFQGHWSRVLSQMAMRKNGLVFAHVSTHRDDDYQDDDDDDQVDQSR